MIEYTWIYCLLLPCTAASSIIMSLRHVFSTHFINTIVTSQMHVSSSGPTLERPDGAIWKSLEISGNRPTGQGPSPWPSMRPFSFQPILTRKKNEKMRKTGQKAKKNVAVATCGALLSTATATHLQRPRNEAHEAHEARAGARGARAGVAIVADLTNDKYSIEKTRYKI